MKFDGFVKSPVFVIARSSANAGRRSNPVFSRTYKNEIASSASGGLAMTLLPTFYEIIKFSGSFQNAKLLGFSDGEDLCTKNSMVSKKNRLL